MHIWGHLNRDDVFATFHGKGLGLISMQMSTKQGEVTMRIGIAFAVFLASAGPAFANDWEKFYTPEHGFSGCCQPNAKLSPLCVGRTLKMRA